MAKPVCSEGGESVFVFGVLGSGVPTSTTPRAGGCGEEAFAVSVCAKSGLGCVDGVSEVV